MQRKAPALECASSQASMDLDLSAPSKHEPRPRGKRIAGTPTAQTEGVEERTRRQNWNEIACSFISLAETLKFSLPIGLGKACKTFLESIWEESIKNGNVFAWRSHH